MPEHIATSYVLVDRPFVSKQSLPSRGEFHDLRFGQRELQLIDYRRAPAGTFQRVVRANSGANSEKGIRSARHLVDATPQLLLCRVGLTRGPSAQLSRA